MKRVRAAMTVALLSLAASALPVSAGNEDLPSTAPTVAIGVPYAGDNTPNNTITGQAEFWRLPGKVYAQDKITIAWRSLPGGNWGPFLCLGGGYDDFDWQGEGGKGCNMMSGGSLGYLRASLGGRRDVITSVGTASTAYLQFWNCAPEGFGCYATGPYQFTVEKLQHKLMLALPSVSRISSGKGKGRLIVPVRMTDGSKPPVGLKFDLQIRRPNGQVLTRTAATNSNGNVVFEPLSIPSKIAGERVKIRVTRAASKNWQRVRTDARQVTIT